MPQDAKWQYSSPREVAAPSELQEVKRYAET